MRKKIMHIFFPTKSRKTIEKIAKIYMSKYNDEIISYKTKNHMLFEKPILYDNHWLESLSIYRSGLGLAIYTP